jgi:hypothetical protein
VVLLLLIRQKRAPTGWRRAGDHFFITHPAPGSTKLLIADCGLRHHHNPARRPGRPRA